MANGRARDERKEQEWQRRIDRWRASGLSVRAFCDRYGLTTPSFYTWRRVLEQRAAETAAFVAVQVAADAPTTVGGDLELVLPGGRTVRVSPGFDAPTLRRLLAALEGEGPC